MTFRSVNFFFLIFSLEKQGVVLYSDVHGAKLKLERAQSVQRLAKGWTTEGVGV
jgi:hypothetical protein